MTERVLHGLIQKALLTASELPSRYRINPDGQLWRMTPNGWRPVGGLLAADDREDFLVSKLTQEDI